MRGRVGPEKTGRPAFLFDVFIFGRRGQLGHRNALSFLKNEVSLIKAEEAETP